MRFKELDRSEMTPAQQQIHDEIVAGPRGRMGYPTNVLARCPGLAINTHRVGEYVRFKSTLPRKISEFAILITARYWDAQYEWHAHYPLAMKAGLSPQVAADLANGKRPSGMADDESAAFDFCTSLHQEKEVNDEFFARAMKVFGEQGVVDLMGVSSHYTLISMVLKVNQQTVPEGVPLPLPRLPAGSRGR